MTCYLEGTGEIRGFGGLGQLGWEQVPMHTPSPPTQLGPPSPCCPILSPVAIPLMPLPGHVLLGLVATSPATTPCHENTQPEID